MSAKVLFFSLLQDITREDETEFSLPSGSVSVGDLLALLFAKYPGLEDWDEKLLIAVNCDFATREDLVKSGDEVAIMPPVQGG